MINHKLLPSSKKFRECGLALWPFECVLFVKLHHWKVALKLGLKFCGGTSSCFLLFKEFFTGIEPFFLGDNLKRVNSKLFTGGLLFLPCRALRMEDSAAALSILNHLKQSRCNNLSYEYYWWLRAVCYRQEANFLGILGRYIYLYC